MSVEKIALIRSELKKNIENLKLKDFSGIPIIDDELPNEYKWISGKYLWINW